MVHSEMCANWEYKKLHEAVEKRAIEEMKHAEKLIAACCSWMASRSSPT